VESHVLALAAMRAEYPDERRALLELRTREEELKETAHGLLRRIWRIAIGHAERPCGGDHARVVPAS
jgi:hypothetical protein